MTTLLGSKKLNEEQTMCLMTTGDYEIVKGVYTVRTWQRNVSTGEVEETAPKVVTDYFIHLRGEPTLNKRQITKKAACNILKAMGESLGNYQYPA